MMREGRRDIRSDLAAAVGTSLRRPGILVTDPDLLAPSTTDYRGWFRGEAIALARPRSVTEVQDIVRGCARHGVALVPQGGNSSLCGGAVPDGGGRPTIVVSLAGLNRVRSVDPTSWSMVAEAGCTLDEVQTTAAKANRRFGLDFGARGSAQLGGFIATNAGGSAVLRYGTTRDLVLGLEVVLPDGRLWSGLRALRKDNSGFDLKHVFIGSEGTIGIVTAATLRLHPADGQSASALFALPTLEAANDLAEFTMERAAGQMSSIELMPRFGIELACRNVTRTVPPIDLAADWYVLVRLESRTAVDDTLEALAGGALERGLCTDAVVSRSASQEAALWKIRDAFSEVHRHLGLSHRFDLSVPLGQVPRLYRALCAALEEVESGSVPFGFGHLGDGNLHFSACQPPSRTAEAFAERKTAISEAVNQTVWRLGGSISAEHGIGRLHVDEMPDQKDAIELDLMRRLKTALDPQGIMNPGVMLPGGEWS